MPRKTYDPKVRAAFIAAAKAARIEGKPWAEVFTAAKKAGYTGTLQGIVKLLRDVAKKTGEPVGIKWRKRKAGRKAAAVAAKVAAAATPVTRGPGRPRKNATPVPAGNGSIEQMVAQLVSVRVRAALDEAIAVLQEIRS